MSAFSTPEERSALQHLSGLRRGDRFSPELGKRLKRVQGITAKIRKKVWRVDPEIDVKSGLAPKVPPAELLTIQKSLFKKDSVSVWVNIYPIHSRENVMLVSEYEKSLSPKETPSIGEQLEQIQMRVPRTEIHYWHKINDRWMLDAARILLLK